MDVPTEGEPYGSVWLTVEQPGTGLIFSVEATLRRNWVLDDSYAANEEVLESADPRATAIELHKRYVESLPPKPRAPSTPEYANPFQRPVS
jgi:hypothetical protein